MCRMLPLEGNTALCIEQDFAIIKATLSQNVAPPKNHNLCLLIAKLSCHSTSQWIVGEMKVHYKKLKRRVRVLE